LVDRAVRVIAAATGADNDTATKLLSEGGDVKTAIVMQRLMLSKIEAAAVLAEHKGNLRRTLGE